jgi:hypothetical protein
MQDARGTIYDARCNKPEASVTNILALPRLMITTILIPIAFQTLLCKQRPRTSIMKHYITANYASCFVWPSINICCRNRTCRLFHCPCLKLALISIVKHGSCRHLRLRCCFKEPDSTRHNGWLSTLFLATVLLQSADSASLYRLCQPRYLQWPPWARCSCLLIAVVNYSNIVFYTQLYSFYYM